jgi:hypothetical protein
VFVGVAVALCISATPRAQTEPVMQAMADELARSMKELRLPDQPAPYYIEYEVEDRLGTRITARLGSIVEDLVGRSRTLRVGVRVGDYAFDSSLFTAGGRGGGGSGIIQLNGDGSTSAPLDDDYDTMRRQIWLATDAAYKRAVSIYAQKRAAYANRVDGPTVPDFSREQPLQTTLGRLPLAVVNRDWLERARQLSAVFAGARGIENSDVQVADTRGTRYFLNSEGFRVIEPIQIATLRVTADARADDGMVVRDVMSLAERNLSDLPSVEELTARTRELAERVRAWRGAPVGEDYTGPVLVEGQAAGEVVAQVLAPSLLARRLPEGGRGGRGAGGQSTPFLTRIGLRVLTDSFSVRATPSLQQFEGRPVAGSFVVDDYGIRAKDISLIEKGRLVALIAGRTPLRGMLQSSGHTRGGDIQSSVLQVESAEAVPASTLKQRYLELLALQDKPFGYILRSIASPGDVPGGGPGQAILQVVRVTPDGRETSVRGLRVMPMAPAVFRDLLDASRERMLYNYRVTNSNAASVIVPNLIFEELEIQATREVTQRPPLVRSPLDD